MYQNSPVPDDVTWPQKVKLVIQIYLAAKKSRKPLEVEVWFQGLQMGMAHGESNGHVTDDVTHVTA